MKNLILSLIAVMLFGPILAQVKHSPTNEAQKVTIEFGRKSRNCEGFGICVFKIELEAGDIIGIIQAFRNKDGKLSLLISPEFYSEHQKVFQNNSFSIDEAFTLDSETARALGLQNGYVVEKGKYPLRYNSMSNKYECIL